MKTIHDAIDYFGSQQALADAVGCSQTAIWKLVKGHTKKISAEFAISIDKATEGDVSKQELRPDIFGELKRDSA